MLPTAPPTWLVVPTYNEAENIEALAEAAIAELPGNGRLLIVDDNSPDGTGRVADAIADREERVRVLHRPGKQGLGPAYIEGFRVALEAGAELVACMDADFSHDPADLGRLLSAARPAGGADLVIGSRYVPGGGVAQWGPLRRTVSRAGSAYARLVLGLDVRDLTGGFKCYRREVLEAIDLPAIASRGYAFQVETTFRAARAGFEITEVPITFTDRRVGASKMSRSIFFEAVWRVAVMRAAQIGGDRGDGAGRSR